MTRLEPQLRDTETYTESNFLRLHTASAPRRAPGDTVLVTIEHLCYRPDGGWRCSTIVDREAMSREDALFIAHSYAERNEVPVIYECHAR
ncbi:MAG TPA: hypothetical protein VF329_11590 [Gammaproteobacteria bacterium]